MIDVIVVNWNSGPQLHACITSILNHGSSLVDKIIVVDNGSADDSVSRIEYLPGITIIRAGMNLGFGRACNYGAKSSTSNYLLFLNPDAELHEGTLQITLDYMQEADNAKVGICGVKLSNRSGNTARGCARRPTATKIVAHAIGIDRLVPRLGYVMREWDHESSRQVDHVIGAYYLVRRQIFEELMGFDERYFLYLEDLDFSYRAKQAGWSIAYLADTQAFHAGGGTSDKIKALRLFYTSRSRLQFASKHFGSAGAFYVYFATLLIEPIVRCLGALAKGSWRTFNETRIAYSLLVQWLVKGSSTNHD